MELFHNAKAIRLKSHHDKYLLANEYDKESVSQDRNGKSSKTAIWNVELVQGDGGGGGDHFIRLKSCYGRYLTASDAPFLLGMTGKKVVQTLPKRLDSSCSSIEWEPIRDGYNQIKLKSRCGSYLRANGRLPPWRNSVTHDVPHISRTQDWTVWDVDILIEDEEELVEVLEEVEVEVLLEEVELVLAEEEEALEEGSSSSRFGFRKFLHELKGGDGTGDGSGEEKPSSSSRFGFRKFLHKLNSSDGDDGESGGGGGGGEVVQEEGFPSSRFGFRKFLHKLNSGDGESSGGGGGGGEEVVQEEGYSSSRFVPEVV